MYYLLIVDLLLAYYKFVAYLLLTLISLIIDSLSRATRNSLPTTYYLLLTTYYCNTYYEVLSTQYLLLISYQLLFNTFDPFVNQDPLLTKTFMVEPSYAISCFKQHQPLLTKNPLLVNNGSWLAKGSCLTRVTFKKTTYRKGGFYHEGIG